MATTTTTRKPSTSVKKSTRKLKTSGTPTITHNYRTPDGTGLNLVEFFDDGVCGDFTKLTVHASRSQKATVVAKYNCIDIGGDVTLFFTPEQFEALKLAFQGA